MSAARSVAAPAWKSSSRPRCSSSRSSRWPRCSCIDQASPSRRVSTAGDRERTFSSRRAGVPRSLSTTVGKTSTGAENWNVRSIHRIVFMGDIIRAGAGPVQSRPMDDRREELLNVYDAKGAVVDARPRRAAKASGLAVGAVNALLVDRRGFVLLQRRPADKENGARWDKSVGGHVSAGEEFDTTLVREAGEELFDDPASPHVRLARDRHEFDALERSEDLTRTVLFHRASFQLNLRSEEHAPDGGRRHVLYHL